MTIDPTAHLRDLQPDGCDPDEPPAMCACGHEEYCHEAIGSGWRFEGECMESGCACGGFRLYDDEEV